MARSEFCNDLNMFLESETWTATDENHRTGCDREHNMALMKVTTVQAATSLEKSSF
jgi:hypothetical protein